MCAVAHREDLPRRSTGTRRRTSWQEKTTCAATRTLEGPACAGSAAVLFSRTFRVFSTSRKNVLGGGSKSEGKGSKPQQDSRECKGSRLTLRNGVWHANDVPCAKYSHALRKTFQTAAISAQPIAKPPRWKIRQRLEERAWWPAYIGWRKARELELLLAECEARQEAKEAGCKKVAPPATFPPDRAQRSLTLRERFLARVSA